MRVTHNTIKIYMYSNDCFIQKHTAHEIGAAIHSRAELLYITYYTHVGQICITKHTPTMGVHEGYSAIESPGNLGRSRGTYRNRFGI